MQIPMSFKIMSGPNISLLILSLEFTCKAGVLSDSSTYVASFTINDRQEIAQFVLLLSQFMTVKN